MVRDSEPTTWGIKGQTSAKHEILRNYLHAWFPIMASRQGRIIFIDGFAGPGVYDGGEPGSPIIALECLLDHRNVDETCECIFLFNEERTDRAERLEKVIQHHERKRGGYPGNVEWDVRNIPFESLVDEVIDAVGDKSLAPTLAFVDPFGISGASMQQLQRLLAYDRCELLIYFAYNSINRFATSGMVDSALSDAFGTTDFTTAPEAGTPDRREFLLDLYSRQLREVAGFPYVQHFRMDNDSNRTVYYLFYATRHTVGLDRMKSAMWRVAPTGNYRFSDRLNGQDVLLGLGEDDADLTPLRDALLRRFAGKTVHINAIEHFVITRTPYHTGHLRRRTLSPMQRDGLVTTDLTRRGSFKNALVTFRTP